MTTDDESNYTPYENKLLPVLDNCARIVIRGIANYGIMYLANPNSKLNSGNYPYGQYIHDGKQIVENGFLKFKITMKVNGTYQINFGKNTTIKGTFTISDANFPVNSLTINGTVKTEKNNIISNFDYTWEGKSFLKNYRYTNSDVIKVPKNQTNQPPPKMNDVSYR